MSGFGTGTPATKPALLGAPPAASAQPTLASVKMETRDPVLGQEQPLKRMYQYVVTIEGVPEQFPYQVGSKQFGIVVKTNVRTHALVAAQPGASAIGKIYGVRINRVGDYSGETNIEKTHGYRALREMSGLLLSVMCGPTFVAEAPEELRKLQESLKARPDAMKDHGLNDDQFAGIQQAWLSGMFTGLPLIVSVTRKPTASIDEETGENRFYFENRYQPYTQG